jgi:hypothetical protein
MFSVNVLIYGDYPALADQCLTSIARSVHADYVGELQIGLNAPSAQTLEVVARITKALSERIEVRWVFEEDLRNVWKYPLMRRMRDLATQRRFVWFDDDTFVIETDHPPHAIWLDLAARPENELVGPVYRMRWTPFQRAQIAKQPWCVRPPSPQATFVQGGFWVAPLAFLKQWDYPFAELRHNGGDTILGELAAQQGLPIRDLRYLALANSGFSGKESGAPRRGGQTERLWQSSASSDLSHQDFHTEIVRWRNSLQDQHPPALSRPGLPSPPEKNPPTASS